jgi:glutaredoxin 2
MFQYKEREINVRRIKPAFSSFFKKCSQKQKKAFSQNGSKTNLKTQKASQQQKSLLDNIYIFGLLQLLTFVRHLNRSFIVGVVSFCADKTKLQSTISLITSCASCYRGYILATC